MAIATSLPSTIKTWQWQWQGKSRQICYEVWGDGQPLLLLPALSTVSSRGEMGAIAQRLLQDCPGQFQVIAVDWPGFGDSDRPRLAYQPSLYRQFLQDFVRAQFEAPVAVVAAGHGAGYVMATAAAGLWSRIVLVAPTWRGPLAAMGAPEGVRRGMESLVRLPVLGQGLYGLNTHPSFLRWMYRRHVFVDATRLTDDFIAERHENTQRSGARYAPGAFVTGGLDPAGSREEFLGYFSELELPVLLLVAEQAPPKSKGEMEAMAELVQSQDLMQVRRMAGTLGMAEEYGEAVAGAIAPFLTASSAI